MRQDLHEQLATAVNDAAVALLEGPRLSVARAAQSLPQPPGLYAIVTNRATHRELGLPARDIRAPICMGKAEDSLSSAMANPISGKARRDSPRSVDPSRASSATSSGSSLGREIRPSPTTSIGSAWSPLPSASFRAGSATDSRSRPASSHRVSCSLTSSVHCSDAGHRRSAWTDNQGRWPRLREARRAMADDARRWAREPH